MQTYLPIAVANLSKPTCYLSCAETAKMVRAALKEAFPEIKFNVLSSIYSMGASITVSWTDGPITTQVDPIINAFSGAGFDGMTDCKTTKRKTLNGESIHFGADYIHSRREISKDRHEAMLTLIDQTPRDMWLTIAVRQGHPHAVAASESYTTSDFAYSMLRSCPPEKFENRKSELADSIVFLGED